MGEIVAEIDATVVGLRMEMAEQKARYTKMHDDTRLLKGEAHLDHQHEPVTDPAA